MRRLAERVALVTGAGSGIGRGVAERLVEEGAKVVAMGRRPEPLEALREACGAELVEPVVADVSRYEDCARGVEAALARWGRLDVAIPNAGVYDARLRLAGTDPAVLDRAFDELFAVNVKGALFTARAAIDALAEQQGAIVFTASLSSVAPGFGGALYVPSKHAIAGLTRQLALELAGRVRVNAVALGYVASDLAAPVELGAGKVLSEPEVVAKRIPTGRAALPADVAGVYAMLASPADGSAITGSVVLVDGGQSLSGPGLAGWDRGGAGES
ncbi:MAG: SDR family oxidoreductase [Actinobacteria bacterium]|nr:SDR family oxidoreductase [Actinomycetota bacterium]